MRCPKCKKKESKISEYWFGIFVMLMIFLIVPVSSALVKEVIFLGFNMKVGTVVVIFSLLIGMNIELLLGILYCNCCSCEKKEKKDSLTKI